MPNIWMSHVTLMNASCHTYGWVMSHIWMSHVTHESCHTYEWVMSHVTHMHMGHESSCHTYGWARIRFLSQKDYESHRDMRQDCFGCTTWIEYERVEVSFAKEPYKRADILQKRPSHVTRMYASCRTCDMTHVYVWHDSFIHVTWLIHMCDMTHSYMWHDSYVCVTWIIRTCDMTHACAWHDGCICVPWLTHIGEMTYSNMRLDLFIHVTSLIRTCDMPHSYMWHDSCIRVHSYWRNDLFTHVWRDQCTSDLSITSLVWYAVATVIRIDKILDLFCRISSLL